MAIGVLPWLKHIRGKKHENTWETRWETRWETPRKMIGTWWVFLYASLHIGRWDGRVASTATERPIYGCLSNAYPVVSMNWEFSLIYDICIERQVD